MTWALAPAGVVGGPSTLKTVGVPISPRGAHTWFNAGGGSGAAREAKTPPAPPARGLRPHHRGKPDQPLDGLALHAQRRQERGDLGVGGTPRHDRLHRGRRLDAREVTPVDQGADGLGDDRVRHRSTPDVRARTAEMVLIT